VKLLSEQAKIFAEIGLTPKKTGGEGETPPPKENN